MIQAPHIDAHVPLLLGLSKGCTCPLCGEPDLPFPGDAQQLALPLTPDPEPLAWPRARRRLADIEAEAFGKVRL